MYLESIHFNYTSYIIAWHLASEPFSRFDIFIFEWQKHKLSNIHKGENYFVKYHIRILKNMNLYLDLKKDS